MTKNQPRSLVGNVGDKVQIDKAEKIETRRSESLDEDLQYILKTENGRRVLRNIIAQCHVDHEIWTPSAAIHYDAGKQAIGFQIEHWIKDVCPDLWIVMEREKLEDLQLLQKEKPKKLDLEESE